MLEVSLRKDGDDYVGECSVPLPSPIPSLISVRPSHPVSIFIGLTRRNLMAQAIRYLFFGEGETGLIVYTILLRYWDWTPEEDVRPASS